MVGELMLPLLAHSESFCMRCIFHASDSVFCVLLPQFPPCFFDTFLNQFSRPLEDSKTSCKQQQQRHTVSSPYKADM